jgi:hypothetical protein
LHDQVHFAGSEREHNLPRAFPEFHVLTFASPVALQSDSPWLASISPDVGLANDPASQQRPRLELTSLDDVSGMEQSIPNWHDGPPENPSVFPKICRKSTRVNARSGCQMIVEMDVHSGIAGKPDPAQQLIALH